MEAPFDPNKITTSDDLLAALRKGNTQKLSIKIGDFDIPVRLLNASEEALIVVKSVQAAQKRNPTGLKQEVFESYENMKAILSAAVTIDGTPGLPWSFLEAISATELADLYDKYVLITRTINPQFSELPPERVTEIVESIKKKTTRASDLFTWELAGVGKFFLEQIVPNLPTDSERGSL